MAEIITASGALFRSNFSMRKIPMALKDKASSNVNEPFFIVKLWILIPMNTIIKVMVIQGENLIYFSKIRELIIKIAINNAK